MSVRIRSLLALTAAAALCAAPFASATASATASPGVAAASASASGPQVTVLTKRVLAPFQLAVNQGRLFVADGGTSTVSRLTASGLVTVASGPQPGEVAGVDLSPSGRTLAYTATNYQTGRATLKIKKHGQPLRTADLGAYEARKNPDSIRQFGVFRASDCVRKALKPLVAPLGVSYHGQVFSHPYSVAFAAGSWVVADAGGNDLLTVSPYGRISTLAVLPRLPSTFTAQDVEALGLPACVIGVTYRFEAAPTDVEVGPDGFLYVTALPGVIFKVNPETGVMRIVARGLAGPTSLAITPDGTIYVAELLGGRISKIVGGLPVRHVRLAGALSVEAAGNRTLYASTLAPTDDQGNPTGQGSLVRITN